MTSWIKNPAPAFARVQFIHLTVLYWCHCFLLLSPSQPKSSTPFQVSGLQHCLLFSFAFCHSLSHLLSFIFFCITLLCIHSFSNEWNLYIFLRKKKHLFFFFLFPSPFFFFLIFFLTRDSYLDVFPDPVTRTYSMKIILCGAFMQIKRKSWLWQKALMEI